MGVRQGGTEKRWGQGVSFDSFPPPPVACQSLINGRQVNTNTPSLAGTELAFSIHFRADNRRGASDPLQVKDPSVLIRSLSIICHVYIVQTIRLNFITTTSPRTKPITPVRCLETGTSGYLGGCHPQQLDEARFSPAEHHSRHYVPPSEPGEE